MHDLEKEFERRYGRPPDFVTSAPGRVEFIGNHTDYNGGEVLGAAIDRCLTVAVARSEGEKIRLCSSNTGETVEFDDFFPGPGKVSGWAAYPMGVLAVLRELGAAPVEGFDFLVDSTIPSGSGLSSSAAFELASALAYECLSGKSLSRHERVRACRRAENEFVGVPCGILDQGVSGFGEKDRLVHIDCRSEKIHTVPGPPETRLWIFQSGKKHSLVESLYAKRHEECSRALEFFHRGRPEVEELVDVSLREIEQADGELDAALLSRARHVVEEHARVRTMVVALEKGDLTEVGRLLCASHWSSSRLFENSIPELDALVEILTEHKGIHGARLTGGGFGGAVMALAREDFREEDAKGVVRRFGERFDSLPEYACLKIADGAGVVGKAT